MSKFSNIDGAALALLDSFNERDKDGLFAAVSSAVSPHLGAGGYRFVMYEAQGPEDSLYCASVVADIKTLGLLEKYMPVIVRCEPGEAVRLAGAVVSHLVTRDGQMKAHAMYRQAFAGQQNLSDKLAASEVLQIWEARHREDLETWESKFGKNEHLAKGDLWAAEKALAAAYAKEARVEVASPVQQSTIANAPDPMQG